MALISPTIAKLSLVSIKYVIAPPIITAQKPFLRIFYKRWNQSAKSNSETPETFDLHAAKTDTNMKCQPVLINRIIISSRI